MDNIPLFQRNIKYYESVSSTMDVARELALKNHQEGTVVVAKKQSHGRGRHGRKWYSPKEGGIWLTAIAHPKKCFSKIYTLSLVMGVGLLDALDTMGIKKKGLKWPNDIVIGDKKIAGILLESVPTSSKENIVLIGIGLNLITRKKIDHRMEFFDRYIGLGDILETQVNYEDTVNKILLCISYHYEKWCISGLSETLDIIRKYDTLYGHMVTTIQNGQNIRGKSIGINENGELLLECEKTHRCIVINAGEVSRVRT